MMSLYDFLGDTKCACFQSIGCLCALGENGELAAERGENKSVRCRVADGNVDPHHLNFIPPRSKRLTMSFIAGQRTKFHHRSRLKNIREPMCTREDVTQEHA